MSGTTATRSSRPARRTVVTGKYKIVISFDPGDGGEPATCALSNEVYRVGLNPRRIGSISCARPPEAATNPVPTAGHEAIRRRREGHECPLIGRPRPPLRSRSGHEPSAGERSPGAGSWGSVTIRWAAARPAPGGASGSATRSPGRRTRATGPGRASRRSRRGGPERHLARRRRCGRSGPRPPRDPGRAGDSADGVGADGIEARRLVEDPGQGREPGAVGDAERGAEGDAATRTSPSPGAPTPGPSPRTRRHRRRSNARVAATQRRPVRHPRAPRLLLALAPDSHPHSDSHRARP